MIDDFSIKFAFSSVKMFKIGAKMFNLSDLTHFKHKKIYK